ncbi:MAG: SixA phosphatase family protein [Alphaproteobacteria bacterium]
MKRLFILRHAQAAAGGFADFERPLTKKGLEDARRLGERMKGKNYSPEHIFCSPAFRTSETLAGLLQTLQNLKVDRLSLIYEGGMADLKYVISQSDDAHGSILLIGHNPSVHQLVFDLSKDEGVFIDRLNTGYPPATLSVLDCPIQSWNDLKAGENKLIDLLLAN